MTYKRWHAIKRAFHIVIFDPTTADASTRADRGHQGQELAAKLAAAWQTAWEFGDAVSIDEAIQPYKGVSNLKVYMKSKPHKWGYKLWLMCDPWAWIAWEKYQF